MRWISIDPGLYRMGFAVWDEELLSIHGVSSSSAGHWTYRARQQLDFFSRLLLVQRPKYIACELPRFFPSALGLTVAARQDLVKLTFLVGAFRGLAYAKGLNFGAVDPVRWKGNLTKELVIKRVRLAVNRPGWDLKHDEAEAIGIGLWYLGRFPEDAKRTA